MIGAVKGGAAVPAAPATDKRAELRAAAEAFEAVFARQMIGAMRQARLAEDIFGSSATDQFRDLSDAELAKNMAAQGGLGIAKMLLQQFERAGGNR